MLMNNKKRFTLKRLAIIFVCVLIWVQWISTSTGSAFVNTGNNGFKIAAENSTLILYYSPETGAFAVQDKRNGYMWSSAVDKDKYDMGKVNEIWQAYMNSTMVINYIDIVKEQNRNKAYASKDAKIDEIRIIENGLAVEFNFVDLGIIITIEIQLAKDSLIIRIPSEKIFETKEYALVELELMPFFGAAGVNVDGYIMYPDGSGAITRYANVQKRPKNVRPYMLDIYAPLKVDLDLYENMETERKYTASLPVYGIKNDQNAMLAAIIRNEENASIRVSPDGVAVNLNRVNFNFTYRHFYTMNLSNIIVNGVSLAKIPTVSKTDKEKIWQSPEIHIFFLYGSDANYSGMANAYREFLTESGRIKQVIHKTDNIPIGLDLFMGVREERLIFSRFIPMTTFNNARTIAEYLVKSGVNDMHMMLKGWTKGGYELNPVHWPPERRLGGRRGLIALAEYTMENQLLLFLQNDFLNANRKNGGFSQRNETVLQGSSIPVTDYSNMKFLLNPVAAFGRMLDFLNALDRYKGIGVALNGIGRYIYQDYNKQNPGGRAETTKKWQDMIAAAADEQRPVAVDGGNGYVLHHADRLYNIPMENSNYFITDESIPFYQMVVHGMIPYTSYPGNLSSDFKQTKLKWVEYGYMPYFELTYQSSERLKHTAYNRLFTSYYGDWVETIADTYKEFNQRLQSVWSEPMTAHEKIGEYLFKVEYGNGTVIYINYHVEDVHYKGLNINAQDYLVVEKGGVLR